MDFSSWQGVVFSVLGLALITLVGMGIRVLMMLTLQQRQQRANRQINERLRTLIAAYKVLGGSFTGDLLVNPLHLRDLRATAALPGDEAALEAAGAAGSQSDRARRIRDAVEAALSDILLLGTEDQVELAAKAARDMVQGIPLETGALVISLRAYIREVLGLDPVAPAVVIPNQGPTRQTASAKGVGEKSGGSGSGGGGGGGMGGMGGGMGMGGGGLGLGRHADDA